MYSPTVDVCYACPSVWFLPDNSDIISTELSKVLSSKGVNKFYLVDNCPA